MIKQMVVGLMLAGAATLAMANDSTSMGASNFKDLDANGDGRVSTTEAQAHAQLNQGFRTADTNGDGYVSQTEFDEADGVVDLYGNEVSDAVARYTLDPAGSLYELHSPQTELTRLGSPKS